MNNALIIGGAHVVIEDRLVLNDILVEHGRIAAIAPSIDRSAAKHYIDAAGMTVLPGFFDIHTHGAVHVDYNHATAQDMISVNDFFSSHGVTSYLPTVITDTVATMKRQLHTIATSELAQIKGIHLEGPFLCKKYKGAMPEAYLRPFDIDLFFELQEAADQKITLITVAPELPGAVKFIEQVRSLGVTVSLGHSSASYEETVEAIEAGAIGTTHIMNAMKLLHMHDPAILTAVLEKDVYAEMICDGFHLHPPIVRLLLKIKGLRRMIAITDSIMATGCPDGIYQLGLNDIEVSHGDAKVVSSGARAGSTLTMDKALRNIVEFTNLPLGKVSALLSANPARMLCMDKEIGTIGRDMSADMVVLDSTLQVRYTISQGNIVYSGARDEA